MADSTLQEHHWFTATTVVMNGFLLNGMRAVGHPCLLKLLATVVSAFAAYLVLERSAFAAQRPLVPPDFPQGEAATWRDKQRETVFKFRTVLRSTRGSLRMSTCAPSTSASAPLRSTNRRPVSDRDPWARSGAADRGGGDQDN